MNYEQTTVFLKFELFVGISVAVTRIDVHELVRPNNIARAGLDDRGICAPCSAAPTSNDVMSGKVYAASQSLGKTGPKRPCRRIPFEIYRLDPGLFNSCGILAKLRHPLSVHSDAENEQ